MKDKNYFYIVLPVIVVIIVFIVDMLLYGVNNSHLSNTNIILIIVLYFVIYTALIYIIKYKMVTTFSKKKYVKTIIYSTCMTKIIFNKNSYLYSNSFLYMSLSYLFQGEFKIFEKIIINVKHSKNLEDRSIWECYYLLINKDFSKLESKYNDIKEQISLATKFQYIDILFKGAILYSHKKYKEADATLRLNKQKFISELDKNIYNEIISSIEKDMSSI